MLHIFGVPSILGLKSRKNNHSPKTFGEKAHLNSVFEFRKLNNCLPSSIGDLTGIDIFFLFSKWFFCSKHSFVLYFLSVTILTILFYFFSPGGLLFWLGRKYLVTAQKEEDYRVLSNSGLRKGSLNLLISITQEAMIVFVAYICDSGHI